MFSPEQIRKYAELKFPNHRFTDATVQRMKCPIHAGHDRNFALNMHHGGWTCHSRCGSGGMVQLENRLHGGTREEATERLFRLVGMAPQYAGKQIVATYDYVDGSGRLLFQKVRLEPKDFRFRTPAGASGYHYTSPPMKRPLYGLPGVLTANCILITEGEKDADSLNLISEWPAGPLGRVYATTAGAAGSWTSEHSQFMAGKQVVIFADNDDKGRASSQAIATSVHPVAQTVKIVSFEEMPEKADVSDFLKEKGIADLVAKIRHTQRWLPAVEAEEPSTIVEGMQFAMSGQSETKWIVEGVIQAEGNGIWMGDPKAGKSLGVLHMIIHLISGTPWLGCVVPNRVKIGLVTREDAPGLTKKRIQRIIAGGRLANLDLEDWLWVNSREQTKTFDIQEDADFSALVRDFRKQQCAIVFFDVFNRIHQLDENDNSQMARVTARLSQFGAEVGCQVGLVHHINKQTGSANVFNRLRGAGALHGWMEWGLAVTVTNPEDHKDSWIRRIDFESKEVTTVPIHYTVADGPGLLRLESTSVQENRRRAGGNDYKSLSAGDRPQ